MLTFVVTPALPTGLRYEPSVADVMGRYPDGGRIVGTPTPQWPYTLTPLDLPDGLTYTPPAATGPTGGMFTGTPTAVHVVTTYTLTATDADGDTATLTFPITVTLACGHLSAPTTPLSTWDTPGAFAAPAGPGPEGLSSADWGTSGSVGGSDSIPLPPGEG